MLPLLFFPSLFASVVWSFFFLAVSCVCYLALVMLMVFELFASEFCLPRQRYTFDQTVSLCLSVSFSLPRQRYTFDKTVSLCLWTLYCPCGACYLLSPCESFWGLLSLALHGFCLISVTEPCTMAWLPFSLLWLSCAPATFWVAAIPSEALNT